MSWTVGLGHCKLASTFQKGRVWSHSVSDAGCRTAVAVDEFQSLCSDMNFRHLMAPNLVQKHHILNLASDPASRRFGKWNSWMAPEHWTGTGVMVATRAIHLIFIVWNRSSGKAGLYKSNWYVKDNELMVLTATISIMVSILLSLSLRNRNSNVVVVMVQWWWQQSLRLCKIQLASGEYTYWMMVGVKAKYEMSCCVTPKSFLCHAHNDNFEFLFSCLWITWYQSASTMQRFTQLKKNCSAHREVKY